MLALVRFDQSDHYIEPRAFRRTYSGILQCFDLSQRSSIISLGLNWLDFHHQPSSNRLRVYLVVRPIGLDGSRRVDEEFRQPL